MTRRNYRVTAVQIEIFITIARVNPYVFSALDYEWKFLVRSDLILLFYINDVFDLRLCGQITYLL